MDAWQLQCCGDPFTVGSTVSWQVREPDTDWPATVFGGDLAATVDAAEEHHDDDLPGSVAGEVVSIRAVQGRFAAEPGASVLTPVERSGALIAVASADGWTPHLDGLSFQGYLVVIRTVWFVARLICRSFGLPLVWSTARLICRSLDLPAA